MKDKNNCVKIQKIIKSQPKFTNEILFPYLINQIDDFTFMQLLCHCFANFSFQVIAEVLYEENLLLLLQKIQKYFFQISTNNYGTRVIQKIICISKNFHQAKFDLKFKELITPILGQLLKELHGNHIIQKYIDEIESEKKFLMKFFAENFVWIINHKYACCTFQKVYKIANEDFRGQYINLLKTYLDQILYEEYGHYIFHFLLDFEKDEVKLNLVKLLLPNLDKICLHKHSSSIIEQIFESSFKEGQSLIIQKISKNENFIVNLAVSQFGNYILQKMLRQCDSKMILKFMKIIAKNESRIKLNFIGNKVLGKLYLGYPEFKAESDSMRFLS